MEQQNRENSDNGDRKTSDDDIKEEDQEVNNSPESMICGPTAPERRHQCKECEKSFNSGKALGGHMSSAHVQASKDYSFNKLNSKITGSSSPGPGPECPICGKRFHSQKSLYGHMRCHPDREWRGMEPPPTTSPDDFADTLRGWPVKAIRGSRVPPAKSQDISSSGEDDGGVWAGHELLRLLKRNLDSCGGIDNGHPGLVNGVGFGNPTDSTVDFKIMDYDDAVKKVAACGSEVNHELGPETLYSEIKAHDSKRQKIWSTNGKIESCGKGKDEMGESKGKILSGPENPNSTEFENDLFFTPIGTQEDHHNQSFDFKKLPILDNVPAKPKPITVKQKDSCLSHSSPDKYGCSICSKVFSSHQALGGHKSSHNKFKINIVNAVDRVTTPQEKTPNCKARKNGEQKQAQLKCDDNNGGNIKDKGIVVRDFDLNMMPDDEDVEDSSADKSEV